MRLLVVILCVLIGSHTVFADLALTVKDIGLMLRSGYSSKMILADLATRHFAETLDADHEAYLLDLHASTELIAALKSGQYAASSQEKLARATVPIQQADEAKRMAQQAANRQAEERQQLTQRQSQSQIVVAPISGQSPEFLTPSEKIAKQKQDQLAAIAEHARYCAEHRVECETLEAAQSAKRDAEHAKHEIEALKTDLWMQGIQR